MKKLISGFSKQLKEAIEIGKQLKLTKPGAEIRNIVVAGMGGSGIGANLVESFTADKLKVPFVITKNYEIPGFVGKNTLFVASSYSGNTEETLSCIKQVLNKKAKIVCITSGGKLLEMANEKDLDHAKIPSGIDCPRACLGYSFVQLLFILNGYGLMSNKFIDDLLASIKLIDQLSDNIHKQAKEIAQRLHHKLPIIYVDNRSGAVATRFQQQINENAKQICHVNLFPEMNHNELVGWEFPENIFSQTAVIIIRTGYDHPRNSVRMNICKSIFERKCGSVLEIKATGNSLIEQSIYLIHLLDWVSVYLAELNEIDPFPVDIINYLKGELSKLK
ncbi:MAG: bifunctional phosphoglucose/phosphomannose isomerase [Cytophagales bacterium]|nr:bifunctional phosphoglucose/phosphomannose isomerase [Cytophagales bacterium]